MKEDEDREDRDISSARRHHESQSRACLVEQSDPLRWCHKMYRHLSTLLPSRHTTFPPPSLFFYFIFLIPSSQQQQQHTLWL